MVAEVFLENGNRVLAVEPNADMRGQMRAFVEQQLGHPAPLLEILDATAEATTLPDAPLDLIAVGRAFHWFDLDRAIAEFRRILKPAGWVALIAADRDRDSKDPAYRPQIDAYENLMSTHGIDYTGVVRSGYRTYDRIETVFDGEYHQMRSPAFASSIGTPSVATPCRSRSRPSPATPTTTPSSARCATYFEVYSRDGDPHHAHHLLDYRRALPSRLESFPCGRAILRGRLVRLGGALNLLRRGLWRCRSPAYVNPVRRILKVLHSRMQHIEPLVAGHASHRPEPDGRHQPVQAAAASAV